MLCFVPVLHGRVWYVCCYVRKKALLQCLQLLRGGIWACMRCPCLCLCWVLDRDYVSQLPCVRYYVFVRAVLNILVRNASPRGPMCCLIFNLSDLVNCYFYFVL